MKIDNMKSFETEKNSALLELAARVAHDIRSPIAVMEMSLLVIESDVPSEKLSMMRLAIQNIRDISKSLLDQYRSDYISQSTDDNDTSILGDSTNYIKIIPIQSLIEKFISQKRHEWMRHSHEIILIISDAAKSSLIKAAPIEITRMLSNLLNNAVEASVGNAKITLEIDRVGSDLNLMISDQGKGMNANEINYFLSGGSSKHSGMGFGLSGAKRYMESIGGAIKINSQLGFGATITLVFPFMGYDSVDGAQGLHL